VSWLPFGLVVVVRASLALGVSRLAVPGIHVDMFISSQRVVFEGTWCVGGGRMLVVPGAQYVTPPATEVPGTFRVSGSNKRMRDLQAIFESPPRVR